MREKLDKTLWGKKEKMLVSNIFFFSYNIFYLSYNKLQIFCHILLYGLQILSIWSTIRKIYVIW